MIFRTLFTSPPFLARFSLYSWATVTINLNPERIHSPKHLLILITGKTRTLILIVLWPVDQQKLHGSTLPNLHLKLNSHSLLTSSTAAASFLSPPLFFEFSGNFQLFVLYHHLLTFAPTELPLSCADLFQYRQPWRARLHTMPWSNGSSTLTDQLLLPLPKQERLVACLIPRRDIKHFPPAVCPRNASQIALLKPQIRQWTKACPPWRWL